VQSYANSYNRYEHTRGLSYEAYFAGRSANLRSSVRRRQRGLPRAGSPELEMHVDGSQLDAALGAYAEVARASWKEAETMVSEDTLQLIRLAGEKRCLRLGILRLNGQAVAAQFWIVSGGVAHCARLGYDEAFKHLAVGVVLTNFMIAHVLDQDHVREDRFRLWDEDYKGGWMREGPRLLGLHGVQSATRSGLRNGLRNILGRPIKRGQTLAEIDWPEAEGADPVEPP